MNQQKQQRAHVLQRQINWVQLRLDQLRQVSGRITTIRLLIFLGGLGLSTLAFFTLGVNWLWAGLGLTLISFVVVVAIHQRVEGNILRYEIWVSIKQTHLARMNLDWSHLPLPLTIPQSERHPLEIDLDLQGKRGLHRLIDVAVTAEGSQRLRQWLITSEVSLDMVLERQALVAELRPRLLFRDKLTLAGKMKTGGNSGELLATQGNSPLRMLRVWLGVLGVAAAINLTLFILNLAGVLGPTWQVGVILALVLSGLLGLQMGDVFKDAAALRDKLEQWLLVFSHLEQFGYAKTPHLRRLCAPFLDPAHRPSLFLRRVSRVVDATGVRGNPIAWLLLNAFFPWDIYFTYRFEQAKLELAKELPVWLEVWHELEALSGLANLGYLNPHYIMPQLQPSEGFKQLSASDKKPSQEFLPLYAAALGHPLIPDAEKVRNDFTFDHLGQLYLITGSNMAGKSTFLRTIGLNLVLAYAGGPVDAQAFAAGPGRLFTCIRVTDSLADGISYFYAEVRRLKALLDELARPHPQPLFFLVDEIFRGTNNRERLIGSRAMIQRLADGNGLGLIATHDLELVQLADITPAIRNIHFREEVHNGQMIFDYQLHAGPSPTTNALKIMALAGLPVPGQG